MLNIEGGNSGISLPERSTQNGLEFYLFNLFLNQLAESFNFDGKHVRKHRIKMKHRNDPSTDSITVSTRPLHIP